MTSLNDSINELFQAAEIELLLKDDHYRAKVAKRFWPKVVIGEGCWNWTASHMPEDYGHININRRPHVAHRVSFVLYGGHIPKGRLVCHSCDNRLCVKPSHLFIGTFSDNLKDCWNKGRHSMNGMRAMRAKPPKNATGENAHGCKLTWEKVGVIRQEPFIKGSGRQLADKFGVTQTLISRIRKGKTWTH